MILEEKTYASEGDRFYDQDGNVVGLVPNKSKPGEFRKPTIADCRKNGWYPSVTTILYQLRSPALEIWKENQTLVAAYNCPPIASETFLEWKSHIVEKANETSQRARANGKLIHKVIEQRIKDLIEPELEYQDYSEMAVAAASILNFPLGVHCEKTFSHPLGFGGCVDFHCEGDPHTIVDWKSFEGEKGSKQLSYIERGVQLRAYQEGLGIKKARLINVFVSVDRPGEWSYYEWPPEEHDRLWRIFYCLLNLYQLMNRL